MGIVIKDLNPVSIGGVRFATGQLDFDSSYPTGGEPILTSLFGVTNVRYFNVEPKAGYTFSYDYDNNKLLAYSGTAAGSISSDSAGTPSGSNSAPAFTGSAASMNEKIENWSIQNIKGGAADTAGSMTTDQASGPVNDDQIDTYAAVAAGAWTYTENNEIDFPRNVCIALWNDTVGAIAMEEAAFSALVSGYYRGASQSDTISETFTAGNKSIAAAQFRWKNGVKPFDSITSVTITGLTANQNTLKIGVGIGRLLGVPQDTKNAVAADFTKIVKNSANVTSVIYNDTHKTIDIGALSDNDDIDISYITTGLKNYTPAGTVAAPAFTGAAMATHTHTLVGQVVAATDLSALTGVRFLMIGN
jgi:hypothetical protein